MSVQAKAARAALKEKAKRLASESASRVDASDYRIPTDMHAEAKTGMRPVSKRAYKRGGAVHGEKAPERADRRPRASGGKLADELVNRNVKAANEERDGIKHTGALKRGGRAHKADGGDTGQMIDPRKVAEMRMKAAADRAGVSPNRFNFSTTKPGVMASAAGLKKGGVVEGSAKDKREDKAMARARGMTMAEWEKSAADKKHDRPKRASGGKQDNDQFPPERGDDRPPMPSRDGSGASANGPQRPVIDLSSKLGKYAKGGDVTAKMRALHDADDKYRKAKGTPDEEKMKSARRAARVDFMNAHASEYAPDLSRNGALYRKAGGKAHPANCKCEHCSGGRVQRATGGRTKSGKTNVNIIIATGQKPGGQDMLPPSMQARPPAMPVPPPAPPPGAPPMGAPMGMPMPPPGGMPMPRARGGRTYRTFKDMDAGALSGKGRLEKTEIQARKR